MFKVNSRDTRTKAHDVVLGSSLLNLSIFSIAFNKLIDDFERKFAYWNPTNPVMIGRSLSNRPVYK